MDRLPQNELDQLREEVARLANEVERLQAEPPPVEKKLTFWERLLGGRLVYEGPTRCDQCKYYIINSYGVCGDCVLLAGRRNAQDFQHCKQFTPRRKYMRRVR